MLIQAICVVAGILIAKKSLFRSKAPSEGGGGSVFFVSRDDHRYLQDEEMREEGGTPRVPGIVRAALAIELKLVCVIYSFPWI